MPCEEAGTTGVAGRACPTRGSPCSHRHGVPCPLPLRRYRALRIEGRDGFGEGAGLQQLSALVVCAHASSGAVHLSRPGRGPNAALLPACPAVTFRRKPANWKANANEAKDEPATEAATASGPGLGWAFLASLFIAVAGNIISEHCHKQQLKRAPPLHP